MATARRVQPCFSNANQIIKTIFNASGSGIAIYDHNRRCAAINRVLADIDGFSVEAHIGKTIGEILGPVGEQIRPKLESAFESREPVFFEVTAQLPTRKEVGSWDVKYIPLLDRRGTVTQVCAIVTELTNRRAIELSLFGFSRKFLALHAALRATFSVEANPPVERQQLLSLAKYCMSEMIAISEMPDSPLGKIGPNILSEYDAIPLQMHRMSPDVESLSKREREVVRFLAEGKSNKEVALALGLSVKTVETYRARVMLKLNAHSVTDLVRYAVRHKFVEA